jgi:hypothetical protein
MAFFKPKIPIWVNVGGSCNGKLLTIWSILRPLQIFYGHLVYFVVIWYILWSFGIFFPVLVSCTKKNLATLLLIGFFERNRCKGRNFTSIRNIEAVVLCTFWRFFFFVPKMAAK